MRARLGDAPVYVSIDIDVLDPAHAPGTGTPEAGGMTSRELLHCLRNLVGANVVGADIVEVAPAYDHAEITGIAAAHVAYELMSVLAAELMTEHRNGGAAVVETLAAHGVDTIFGIPGTHNLELYRHFGETGIRAITPRHEQGAGYAAEAYARVSGRPGRRGHHQRARPDQRDDCGRHRLRRIPAGAVAVFRHAHRRRGPRPRSTARGQERQRRNGSAGGAGAGG